MRVRGLVLALLLMGVMLAPLGARADDTPFEVGAVIGNMRFGKSSTGCAADGTGPVAGAGLGPVNDLKGRMFWRFDSVAVASVQHGMGTLKLCGTLSRVADNVVGGQGPNCTTSKGYAGQGQLVLAGGPAPAVTVTISDVGWKVHAENVITMLGRWRTNNNNGTFSLPLTVDFNKADCLSKNSNATPKAGGETLAPGQGAWKLLTGLAVDDNQPTVTCKSNGNNACLYGDKAAAGTALPGVSP